ncbi:MAG: alanine racemase [Marinilabiliales bacterium]|nr:MAG: alanine racemase [Marinilabiliales bacterium]
MADTSIIEISRKAVEGNIGFLRHHLGDKVQITSVVKSNAYGHGMEQYVPVAEGTGIDHFSVFSACEAKRLKKITSPGSRIMIMGWLDDNDIEWAVRNEVEFFVFDLYRLKKVVELNERTGNPALVHLETETGMNRTGMKQSELRKAAEIISGERRSFELKGICTHLAGAESIANHVRIQKQISRFTRICKWFAERGLVPEYRHVASSAAALTYPSARFDMVRMGILQYGYWPSAETFIQYIGRRKDKEDPLNRVISWKSRIMSIQKVKRGEFVSYGTIYLAQEDKKIAVIPVGYSHGYNRSLSNQGRVLINSQRVGVIGLVNMNMLIADVTQLPDVKTGDEVVLIGSQGDLTISVASFSEFSNQLNYELLTRLPEAIPRFIVN